MRDKEEVKLMVRELVIYLISGSEHNWLIKETQNKKQINVKACLKNNRIHVLITSVALHLEAVDFIVNYTVAILVTYVYKII